MKETDRLGHSFAPLFNGAWVSECVVRLELSFGGAEQPII
jgi:hypothetical protein